MLHCTKIEIVPITFRTTCFSAFVLLIDVINLSYETPFHFIFANFLSDWELGIGQQPNVE